MDTSTSVEEFVTHSDGFGDCKFFSLLGKDFLLSCGADGDIRMLDLSGEREPTDMYIGSTPIYQLACITEPTPGILFACEDNILYWIEFTIKDFSKHKKRIITRFSSAVYCVSTDLASHWVAAGAADFTIKLLPTDAIHSTTQPTCHVLDSHLAPVLSLSFSSDGLILCSTSCDGQMLIWCTGSRTVKHKVSVLSPKVSDLSLSPSRLVVSLSRFIADRCLIATPQSSSGEEGPSISVYSSSDYKLIDRLVSGSNSGTFHCTTWSPDGIYLAAGTSMGHILIWNCSVKDTVISFTQVSLLRHTLRGEIVSISWGVSSKSGKPMLAAFTKSGYLLLHDYLELVVSSVEATANESGDSLLEGLEAADLFDSQESQLHHHDVIESQDVQMNIVESEDSLASKPELSPVRISERTTRKKRKFAPEWEEDVAIYEPEDSQSCPVPLPQPEPRLQPQECLQPSSWPPFSQIASCEHVCLCYNLVGVVISHKATGASQAENENKHFNFLIEVEFHDRGVHHPLQLIDPHWFSVGVITEELLALGGSGKRNVSNQQKDNCLIQVHRFNSWDGSKEWNAQLPEGENILCLAAGIGWIVAVSDTSILRLFGSNGTQFDLLRLSGYPVASAGRGNRLICVYHQNSALVESQNMSFSLLAISGMRFVLLAEGSLTISLTSELKWIGFTSSLVPAVLDSFGNFEVGRVNSRGVMWSPMLDFNKVIRRKKSIHKVVILGIALCLVEPSEEEDSVCNEEIRYLVPSHGSDFPSLHPRPSVQCVTYSPPFCSISAESLSLEQRYFLSTFCYGQTTRRSQEELMRLFALVARGGSFQKALEVGALLDKQHKQVAITFSSRLQLSMLCQKMKSLFEACETTELDTYIPMDSDDPVIAISQAEHELTLSQDSPLVPGEEIAPLLSAIRSTSTNKETNIFSSAPSNPFKNQKAGYSRASSIDKNFIQSVIQRSLGDKHAQASTPTENKQNTASVFSKQTKLGETRPEKPKFLVEPVKPIELVKPVELVEPVESMESVEPVQSVNLKPVLFKDWFEQTMPQIAADNPDLNKGELIKLATKKWREAKGEDS